MEDLFAREQSVFDKATGRLSEIRGGEPLHCQDFEAIVSEYGKLLRQLRRVTKLSDRTTVDLNTLNLDLLDKVHYDALTGIYNRRFLEENLAKTIRSACRADSTLSVMMIDIDFFKQYNDAYGHGMGDDCLKAVAEAIRGSLAREGDFAARYGGEEFAVVLPNTGEKGARVLAERVLESVRALGIPHERSSIASVVTVSVGVTTGVAQQTDDASRFLDKADKALYTSKQSGRNKYTFISFREEVL